MYEVTNHGNSRNLPYKDGYVFINKGGAIKTDDKEMAEALGKFHLVTVKKLTQPEDVKPEIVPKRKRGQPKKK